MLTDNSLFDPLITSTYYDEYLATLKRYQNVTRTNIFCKYFNIHTNSSIVENETITFDRFASGIVYDSYDYTPVIEMSGLTDSVQERKDTTGDKFESSTEITIYTIEKPRPNDLVIFPYDPEPLLSVFRVKEISTALSARNSDLYVFRITLDYAPITPEQLTSKIQVENKYVYLNSEEKNIPVDEYIDLTKHLDQIRLFFDNLVFNEKLELYAAESGLISLRANKDIYNLLSSKKHNSRYFSEKKLPFGIKRFTDIDIVSNDFDVVDNILIPIIVPSPLTETFLTYNPTNPELLFHLSDLLLQYNY
ncbi:MAG: hypothetical protein DRG78_12500 [Epsilonproteobacteria bacterium]|nr:MAG: hypothetical protein DRG78_12500 [Campylobacterota bacterium]